MRRKVSDYIADFLVDNGVTHNFTVPGGGAMHLNTSFGHKEGLHTIYNQHEQACAIAAEAYVRIYNKLPLVCVTTGPGGTNTLTGVVGAWLDSIPMLIISGQVRYAVTARSTGLNIRALGDQEFDITKCVASMTKYAEMVIDPLTIQYHLQKALYLARTGRPGPVWLDIPLDVQGGYVDTEDLIAFDPAECEQELPPKTEPDVLQEIIRRVRAAKRPVFNAGSAIRTAGAFEQFEKAVRKLNIPVVTGWNSIDLIPDEDELYVGRAGGMGDRPGNFAIQNSDLILSVGSRLGVRQVGYDVKTWAREAFVIMVDADRDELKKPTIHVELPVHADAKEFLTALNEMLGETVIPPHEEWNAVCRRWKKDYPVVLPKHYEEPVVTEGPDGANVYCFIKELSRRLPEGRITVVGNGSACVVGSHAYVIKKGQRFIINSGAASMGYDLPAAIGACFAAGGEEIICVTGDGSIQMNLQELQTIVHHKLPIKLFVINNGGYHSMRQTQHNFFYAPYTGIGVDSGDISFPDMEKISWAYGIPYHSARSNAQIGEAVEKALAAKGYCMCEIFVTYEQNFEPKSSSKKLEDGSMISPPLEDLAPFLPREELEKIMLIPLVEE